MSRVAVLGCGPAGLSAAHAVTVAGHDVVVYSKRRKSEMFGAQYLHKPIPGMTSTAPRPVQVILVGTHEEYRQRVYGEQASLITTVSTEDLPEPHDSWDIRSTYDNLWSEYASRIKDWQVSSSYVPSLVRDSGFDLVLSTIPAPALCAADHAFRSQDIWTTGDAPERGTFVDDIVPGLEDGILICNGGGSEPWYRAARVFGYATVEWPLDAPPQGVHGRISRVSKPISTDCDCYPEVVRLGRYGQWKKGVLVHHAYEEALDACLAL